MTRKIGRAIGGLLRLYITLELLKHPLREIRKLEKDMLKEKIKRRRK